MTTLATTDPDVDVTFVRDKRIRPQSIISGKRAFADSSIDRLKELNHDPIEDLILQRDDLMVVFNKLNEDVALGEKVNSMIYSTVCNSLKDINAQLLKYGYSPVPQRVKIDMNSVPEFRMILEDEKTSEGGSNAQV